MPTPSRGSNTQFVAGGLYPGGTGVVKDIGYKLWDYNGNQPANSQMCVEMLFTPTDGGNEGKDVVVNWNVGTAANYQPDPSAVTPGSDSSAFYLDMKGTGGRLIDSSNWHFAYHKGFIENCGMPGEQLDGPQGMKCLIGAELTMVRMLPPARDFRNDPASAAQAQAPGQPPKRINEILVPTRAKFPWEAKGGARRPTAAPSPAASATAAPTASSAVATGNGHSSDLAGIVLALITSNKDGYIDMSQFPAQLLSAISERGIKGKGRINLIGESRKVDIMKQIAADNNLLLEDFAVADDGSMTGTLSTQ
jgi:hypothetical protein